MNQKVIYSDRYEHISRGGGGGGGALRYRGGPHLHYVFRGRRCLFSRPPHVRDFVKEWYITKYGGCCMRIIQSKVKIRVPVHPMSVF